MSLVFQKIMLGYDFNQKYSSQHNMNHLHVWEEYKDRCIEKIKHGDDLYMIVWDEEEDIPKEIRYGSESVNSFSKYASYEDAEPEYIIKYENWKKSGIKAAIKKARKEEANKLLLMRRLEYPIIVKYDLSIKRLREVYNNLGYDNYIQLIHYVNKNFRNIYKKELQNRIIKYLKNQLKNLTYRDMQLLKMDSSKNYKVYY